MDEKAKEKVEEIIEHYGIKGMRWGVRRKRGKGGRVSSDYSTSRPGSGEARSAKGTGDGPS